MTTPTISPTAPPGSPATRVHTHPCARCGAPVALDVGLCERCNPLGLRDSASSQVHGTVFVALVVAILALAVGARFAVAGIGPFTAAVAGMTDSGSGLVVQLQVTNTGTSPGTTTCRISDPALEGSGQPVFVLSPRIAPGSRVTFEARLDGNQRSGPAARHRVLVAVTEAPPAAARAGSDHADDLALAIEVAGAAGRLLMERYERVERVDYKSARDIVTEVDHLSEELIIAAIRERHPADGILAEESGGQPTAAGDDAASGRGRIWIIDPVDGTINYANGIPFFCVSIGLAVDGRPAVGVVLDPTRGDLFAAAADGPATLNGTAIAASDKDALTDFVVAAALAGRAVSTRGRNLRKAIRITRSMGSSALALAYVANGRFDAFVQQGGMSNWDVAAGGLIAERAGATVTDAAGGAWFDIGRGARAVSVLAAPPVHHARLLELTR